MSYLFSVIIPGHNRPDFLKRALSALEEQELPKDNFEVIVILSPNDTSFPWLSEYKTELNLRFLSPQEDLWEGKNVSFKRNYGASISKADWIAFTDDDCVPQPAWLSMAAPHIKKDNVAGVEGKTLIPLDSPKTLTWKGAQRLSNFGGYQTCNVFYRKKIFLAAGGFDSENFPWFLEDTDLAWSVLDTGMDIIPEALCTIMHPIGPGASWRILHEAKRAGLKIKLFEKHPTLYREKKMKTLRKSHYLYLLLYVMIITAALFSFFKVSLFFLAALLTILTLHMIKTFKGLQFSFSELYEVSWRTLLYPILALASLLRAKMKSNLTFIDFIKILRP